MKKLLTAIVGLSVLAAGILGSTPAPAQFYTFGENPEDDLNALWLNGGQTIINATPFNVTNQITNVLNSQSAENIALLTLLQDPNQMDNLYAGNVYNSSTPSGFGVYSKEGCSVDAGCALKAIGLVNTLNVWYLLAI